MGKKKRINRISSLVKDLELFRSVNAFKGINIGKVAYSTGDTGTMVTFRFNGYNMRISDVIVSPEEVIRTVKDNFTWTKRIYYGELLYHICLEAILLFEVFLSSQSGTELRDDLNSLSKDNISDLVLYREKIDNTLDLIRRNSLHFISDITGGDFSSNVLGPRMYRKYKKLIEIFIHIMVDSLEDYYLNRLTTRIINKSWEMTMNDRENE